MSHFPLTLEASFSRDSILVIKSNQKMIIPPFVDTHTPDTPTNERKLIEMA